MRTIEQLKEALYYATWRAKESYPDNINLQNAYMVGAFSILLDEAIQNLEKLEKDELNNGR